MRRFILILLAAAMIIFAGCSSVNAVQSNEPAGFASDNQLDSAFFFDAVILEINGTSLLVECAASESNAVPAGSQVSFSIAGLTGAPNLSKGDSVRVWFDGSVMETYPLQLGQVYALSTEDGTMYTAE